MFDRVTGPLAAALVAAAALMAMPSVAYADCGGGPSAQHVYSECIPGASGGKATKAPPASRGQGGSTPVSQRTANAIAKAGKDSRFLSAFASGGKRLLPSPSAGSESASPGILGSAFDLGSGPLALLVILTGTAALILAASGLRGWRRR